MSVFLTVPLNKSAASAYPACIIAKSLHQKRSVGCLMYVSNRKSSEKNFNQIQNILGTSLPKLMSVDALNSLLEDGHDAMMDEVFARYRMLNQCDTVIVEGFYPDASSPFLFAKNQQIAVELNAKIILVVDATDERVRDVAKKLNEALREFSQIGVAGYILVRPHIDTKRFLQKLRSLLGTETPCLGLISPQRKDVLRAHLDVEALNICAERFNSVKLSPAAFRHNMMSRAIAANKRIVLPEGDEPRTVQAAVICQNKGIARCVLLADRNNVEKVAKDLNITLPESLEIINPADIADKYVEPLVEMRKAKGMTSEKAREALEDSVFVGTMMMALKEVDGLVSGAVHTTANTIRPALQVIKTAPDASLVSSVFFMLMPEQVLVYGDCAVNPKPTAEELADIAIQSADSAKAFGIEPRVAMISYSTGTSGSGEEVEKVIKATHLAQQKRPDLMIDGPLQYDAASVLSVGKQKAPNSPVAGQATVFIFPDLNTGNCTYKAVQRSANVLSVGPMLQGLNKPVNDLSRGALVGDIVYTIALTAIQAQQFKN